MFVLDASVLANWCFPDEYHAHADAARARIVGETAFAPSLLWFEIRNILLVGERRNRLLPAQTSAFLLQLANLPIEIDQEPNSDIVLTLARAHRLSAYDAAYLELARRLAIPLATLDRALVDAARLEGVLIVGEWT